MDESLMMVDPELVHDGKKQKLMSSGSPSTHQLNAASRRQKYLLDQTTTSANNALEYYNQKTGLSYTLVLPLNSNGRHRIGMDVVHVNFTAKKEGSGSGISEHFFAELTYNQPFEDCHVWDCVTFDPDDESNISDRCTMCLGNFETPILHPAGHYVLGQYPEHTYFCECHPEMAPDEFLG